MMNMLLYNEEFTTVAKTRKKMLERENQARNKSFADIFSCYDSTPMMYENVIC